MHLTVGGWVLFIIITIFIIFIGIAIGWSFDEFKGAIIGFLISIIISFPILIIFNWYYNNTASGARAIKTQESNFNQGIQRKVTVYDVNGKVIQEYEGKFDIEYDDDRILFDDEKGLRHIIYYPTGTVIVDEISK